MDLIINPKDFTIKNGSSKLEIDNLLKELEKVNKNNSMVQIFDNKSVLSRTHLFGACANSVIAFKNHTNRTRHLGMEMLLFAAMTDQIEKAIEVAGAKNNNRFIVFSNSKVAMEKSIKFLKLDTDFNPSISEMQKTAKLLNIKFDKKNLENNDLQVLRNMTLSRLSN